MNQLDVELIFVVGASRSGTTMLSRILGRNRCLFGMQELHFFGDIWDPNQIDEELSNEKAAEIGALLLARQRKDIWGGGPETQDYELAKTIVLTQNTFTYSSLYRAVVLFLAEHHGKTVAVEQTPRNVYYLPNLLKSFPSSRVIEVVRDPRAVLYSQRQRWKMRSLGAKNVPRKEILRVWFNYHATTMSLLWRKAVWAGMAVSDDPRVKRVRYEDIVDHPEKTVYEICLFLGIEFSPDMLSIPRVASSTATNAHQHSGISRESIDAWQIGLPIGEREICERITGDTARELGYNLSPRHGIGMGAIFHMLRFPLHAMGTVISNPKRTVIQLKSVL